MRRMLARGTLPRMWLWSFGDWGNTLVPAPLPDDRGRNIGQNEISLKWHPLCPGQVAAGSPGADPAGRPRSSESQNPRRSACLTSSCRSESMGSADPCSRRASRFMQAHGAVIRNDSGLPGV